MKAARSNVLLPSVYILDSCCTRSLVPGFAK